jgi:transcriptional regulator
MFTPKLYRNENFPEIENFLRHHSFASLVSMHGSKPWATHIPLELEINANGEKVLWCIFQEQTRNGHPWQQTKK